MKPLSELVKEWRQEGAKVDNPEDYTECADELQAWLREADGWLWRTDSENGEKGVVPTKEVRRDLLGTTRTEGEKWEKQRTI